MERDKRNGNMPKMGKGSKTFYKKGASCKNVSTVDSCVRTRCRSLCTHPFLLMSWSYKEHGHIWPQPQHIRSNNQHIWGTEMTNIYNNALPIDPNNVFAPGEKFGFTDTTINCTQCEKTLPFQCFKYPQYRFGFGPGSRNIEYYCVRCETSDRKFRRLRNKTSK